MATVPEKQNLWQLSSLGSPLEKKMQNTQILAVEMA
jgi:hypothetical protein